ncbi:MAG: HNH endonuclease [Planctomycetes bacterium]|nr:HNH endonuclease [Planctomycetota bacterium]
MNFRLHGHRSIFLMSIRKGAPYQDRVEENGKVLIYEGHDIQRSHTDKNPKTVDQPVKNPGGSLTQNGLFYEVAQKYKKSRSNPEFVRVYEKIKPGIWVYNGIFKLVDSWIESTEGRKVFKYRLELSDEQSDSQDISDLNHNRLIPTSVKLDVWKRDKGRCVKCKSPDNLHFDHILPFSKGGTSLKVENIQLLCARHNLIKRAKIE